MVKALLVAFALVSLAELGDKTQLTLLTLSVKYKANKVIAGAATAYVFLCLIAVVLGTIIFELVPSTYIKIASSLFFIIFGIYSLIKKPEEESEEIKKGKGGFLTTLGLIGLTEFGDKTQLITIALAAKFKQPVAVFLGSFLGLTAIGIISVTAGRLVLKFVKNIGLLHKLAGVVFIVLGVVTYFA